MNKIKLISPLFVGAASLVPLMTISNCNSMGNKRELEVDLSKEWAPSKSKFADKEGGYTAEEMTKKYFEAISNDPLYLMEDFAYLCVLEAKVTGTSGKYKISVGTIDVANQLISLKFDVNVVIKDDDKTVGSAYQTTEWVNLKIKVESTPTFKLTVAWTEEEILQATNWKFKNYVKIQIDDQKPQENLIDGSDKSTEEEKKDLLSLFHDMEIRSYYMSDCTPKEE